MDARRGSEPPATERKEQDDETVDHLLVSCVYTREVWYCLLLPGGWAQPALMPGSCLGWSLGACCPETCSGVLI